jgi:hypothetical protein
MFPSELPSFFKVDLPDGTRCDCVAQIGQIVPAQRVRNGVSHQVGLVGLAEDVVNPRADAAVQFQFRDAPVEKGRMSRSAAMRRGWLRPWVSS